MRIEGARAGSKEVTPQNVHGSREKKNHPRVLAEAGKKENHPRAFTGTREETK